MGIFTKLAQQIFASGDENGNPRSISEQDAAVWGTELERAVSLFISSGGLIYPSKAALDADLAHGANAMAWVLGDPVADNNGVYGKIGASGSGAWSRRGDLPFSFIIASDAGAGTPNAIQATTSMPVSGSALVWMNIADTNAGSPVTVSINGGSPLTIKTNSGNDVAAGGLVSGMILLGIVSGSTFRLVSDQSSAAIVAAAEAAQAAAEAAQLAAEVAAAAAALRDPEAFAMAGNGTAGPYDVGELIAADSAIVVFVSGVAQIVGTDFTYSGSEITFTSLQPTASDVVHGFVFASRAVGVPTAASVGVESVNAELREHILSLSSKAALVDESAPQLKLNYHKARSSWHVKAFGNSLTDVGGGNASVDTAALQSAFANEQIIDITGCHLHINNVINVGYPGANLASSLASRVGATASSLIAITDTALPILFNATSTNFEASGFHIDAGAGNATTILFNYKRPNGSASDIDAVIDNVTTERGAKLFHVYGRGLRVTDSVIANVQTCVGDIDWPTSWAPNGSTNDLQETGMRAYHLSDLRFHGCVAGVRNIGANAKNCRGILMDNILADIGVGAAFRGLAIESLFTSIVSQLNATTGGMLFDLAPGSRKSDFIGFKAGGFYDGNPAHTRLSNNLVNINATTADNVEELHFIGGSLGPCNRDAVRVFGGGKAKNILFQGVSWERCGMAGGEYAPISLFNSGGDTFTELTLKLAACNFDTAGMATPHIINGTNSSAFKVLKDSLTTKPDAISWAQSNVVLA